MATTTPKLGLPRPEGHDNVTRENHVELIDAIDENATAREDFEDHSAQHEAGGTDEINLEDLPGESAVLKAHKADYAPHAKEYQPADVDETGNSYPVGVTRATVHPEDGWPVLGVALTTKMANNALMQLLSQRNVNGEEAALFLRSYHSYHGWTDWERMETPAGAQAKADAAEQAAKDASVSKSGDTMTGELVMEKSGQYYIDLIRTGNNAAHYRLHLGYGHFAIGSESENGLLVLTEDGQLGIGTGYSSSGIPSQYKMDIGGNMRIQGDLTVSGSITGGLDTEEGEFTPYFYGRDTAGNHTYVRRLGIYKRVGDMVHISIRITLISKDSSMSGQFAIGGLPFTPSGGSSYFHALAISDQSNILYNGQLIAYVPGSASRISLREINSGEYSSTLDSSSITSVSNIAISGVYPI